MGTSATETDGKGRLKAQCRECGGYYHRVGVHVASSHGMTVEDYQSKYPGAPIRSDTAEEKYAKGKPKKAPPADVEDGVLIFGKARHVVRTDLEESEIRWVPKHDEDWEPDFENLNALALGMEDDDNVLIVGPPGVGKTTLAKELAALIRQPLRRLPFNGEMRLSSLIGKGALSRDDGGGIVTEYSDGPLVDAAERGHWVLFDEFDSAPSTVTFVLHSVLEPERQLTLMEKKGGVEVKFDPKFRVIATANTLGYGDDSGLYSGTAPMNEALLDRFGIVIQMDYPKPDVELRRVMKRTSIHTEVAEQIIKVANLGREAWKQESTMVSFSPRRVFNWAKKTARLGDVRQAARYTVTNKCTPDDQKYVEGLIQRVIGKF